MKRCINRSLLIFFFVLCFPLINVQAEEKAKFVPIAITHHKNNKAIDPNKASWLYRLFRWGVSRRSRISVISNETFQKRLRNSQSASPQDKLTLKILRKYIKNGKLLYHRFKNYSVALKTFNVAEKLAKKITDWPSNEPNHIMQINIYKGLCFLALQKGAETRDQVMKTIQLDPSYEPDDNLPSSYTNYYKTIRNWMKNQPQYTLSFDTTPGGARVYFNQKYQGQTPVTIRSIFPGRHTIRIELAGYKKWSNVVNLDAKKLKERYGNKTTFKNQITLKRDPKALSLNGLPLFARDANIDDNILDRLQKICTKVKAKYLYAVEPRKRLGKYFLRLAIFKKDQRTIRYKVLALGRNRAEHRTKIILFAKALERQIAPAPKRVIIARKPPRKVAIVPRRVQPYRPPPRRYQRPRRSYSRREPIRRRPRYRRPTRSEKIAVAPRFSGEKKEEPKRAGKPIYAKWWFWTTIGVAAAAGAGGYAVYKLTGPPPNATFIITSSQGQ